MSFAIRTNYIDAANDLSLFPRSRCNVSNLGRGKGGEMPRKKYAPEQLAGLQIAGAGRSTDTLGAAC